MPHECHFDAEGKNPTDEDCRACENYNDTTLYSEDVSRKYWEMLSEYVKEGQVQDGIEKLMQSDQIAHLFCSLGYRSHLMSPQMQMFVKMFGQKVDLISCMQTAFALGFMLAMKGMPETLTWDMLNGEEEQGNVIGDVEKFLKEAGDEGDTGNPSNTST